MPCKQERAAHLSMKLPVRTTPSFLSWSALLETWVNEPRIAAAGSLHTCAVMREVDAVLSMMMPT